MCYKSFSICAQAVRARPPMRPHRAVLLTPPLQTSAFLKTRLSPFLATHPKNLPISPLLATLPKTASRKPFVCHTYDIPRGVPAHFRSSDGERQTTNGQHVSVHHPFVPLRWPTRSARIGVVRGKYWETKPLPSVSKEVSGQAGPVSSKPRPGRRSILGWGWDAGEIRADFVVAGL